MAGRQTILAARWALGALALLAAVAAVGAAEAQTRQALVEPGLEGPATAANGFELAYGAQLVGSSCPDAAASGSIRNGDCAVNMGTPGPGTGWSAHSYIKSYLARGNRLADFASFGGWHDIPNGVTGGFYQFFFRIDSTGTTGVADRCIVQSWGSQPALPTAGTSGFEHVTFADAASLGQYADSGADCAGGPATDTIATLQARYPNAHVLAMYVQVVGGPATWPSGEDVYLDDLEANFTQSPGILAWHSGDKVSVDEATLSSDTYNVTLGRQPGPTETVTVTPSEVVAPGAAPQLGIAPTTLTFNAGNWNVPQKVTVTAVDDDVPQPGVTHEVTVTHDASSSSATSAYNAASGPNVPVTVREAQLREALYNPEVEGRPTTDNGFVFSRDAGEMAGPLCPIMPMPPGWPVNGGDCAVNLGQADIPQIPGTLAYSAVMFPLPYGNRLADFESFTAWLNLPNGTAGVPGARLHYYFRFASTGAGPADRCANSGTLVPLNPLPTGTWVQLDLLGPASNVYGDSPANMCIGALGGAGDSLTTLKARYPNAEIRALYVQLEAPECPYGGVPCNWPDDEAVVLDTFSALFRESETVEVWEGSGLAVSETTPTNDTYRVRPGRRLAAGETVTVTPSERVPPGGSPQIEPFSPASYTFQRSNWHAWQNVTVWPIDDFVAETTPHNATIDHEAQSSIATSRYNSYVPASLNVAIEDDDAAGIVQSPDNLTLDERDVTATAAYGIRLGTMPLPGETVTVTVTTDGQTEVDTDPLTPGTLENTFDVTAANYANQPFPVRVFVVDDTADEPDPHLGRINATTSSNIPTSPYNTAPTNTANTVNVTIGDNDPTFSIAWAKDAVETGGHPGVGQVGAFTVTRGPDTLKAVTVAFAISTGTATQGSDYTLSAVGPAILTVVTGSGTLTLPANMASATIRVAAPSDGVNEVTENVTLTLNATGCGCAVDPSNRAATVLIYDADQPDVKVEFVQDAYEDDPGAPANPKGTFRLTRDETSLPVNVTYQLSGSAVDGTHYTMDDPSPVYFAPGVSSVDVNVTAIDDDIDNLPRLVRITLLDDTSSPITYYVDYVTPGDMAELKIIGNDRPTVWVVATDNSTSEDPAVLPAVYTLYRTEGHVPDEALTVFFTMGGTSTYGAVPSGDYVLFGEDAYFPPAPHSVTFPVGQNTTTLSLDADQDGINEVTETANITLEPDSPAEPLNPSQWYLLNATLGDQATVTIEDFDPTVVCITGSSDAKEHYVTDGSFVLTRIRPDLAIDVAYTITGIAHTGSNGDRYELSPASPVHFNASQATVTIRVRMPDDHVTIGNGTLTLTLEDGSTYDICDPMAVPYPGEVSESITLIDNEDAAVSVATATDATEGSIVGRFNLTRDDPDMPILVGYTLAGTASPADYTAAPVNWVSFGAGQANATVTITAPSGDGDENTEDLTLTLVDTGGSAPFYHLGATPTGTLRIHDVDPPNISPDGFFAFNDCPAVVPAPGVLANDNPPPGKTYWANAWNGSTLKSGTVFVNEDGSLLYTPPASFLGLDEFSYNNTDGVDTSLDALVRMTVVANTLPAASFTTSTTNAQVGQRITFRDTSSDPEGPITGWVWDFGDGAQAASAQATHAFNRGGTFTVRLTVLDGQCATGTTETTVTVGFPTTVAPEQPNAPGATGGLAGAAGGSGDAPLVAYAGPDQTALEGSIVALEGSVPGADPQASILYRWIQEKGEPVKLDVAAGTASFKAPTAGATGQTLQFRLEATVDGAAAVPDRVLVDVVGINHAPVARLVAAPAAAPGETVTLDATGSTDADGDTLTFTFDQVDGAAATLGAQDTGVATARLPTTEGAVQFRVRVSDGRSVSSETVAVQVRAAPALPEEPEEAPAKSAPAQQLAANASLAWAWWAAGALALLALVALLLVVRRRRKAQPGA